VALVAEPVTTTDPATVKNADVAAHSTVVEAMSADASAVPSV
jgi:hypothetical protein